jgi:hypothetical protein
VASETDSTWKLLDRIIEHAHKDDLFDSPWVWAGGELRYQIDEPTLSRLLAVPLLLGHKSQSGLLSKPLDVWVAHELRRAGFDPDIVWPRATPPRVLPAPVAKLIRSLPKDLRAQVANRVHSDVSIPGVTSANADIVGKLYPKQVDAGMARWQAGPEALISTKRMDRAFAANAKNRAEESYGDAKNLRLRYPLAALGFVFAVRSTILEESPRTFAQLIDSLTKLGEEQDAYHATCLLVIEYADSDVVVETPDVTSDVEIDAAIADLPPFALRWGAMPDHLRPDVFLTKIVNRVLDVMPNEYHEEARRRRGLVIGGVPEAL